MDDTDLCYCGHVRDEHERGGECTVEECKCVHFEHDPEPRVPALLRAISLPVRRAG